MQTSVFSVNFAQAAGVNDRGLFDAKPDGTPGLTECGRSVERNVGALDDFSPGGSVIAQHLAELLRRR